VLSLCAKNNVQTNTSFAQRNASVSSLYLAITSKLFKLETCHAFKSIMIELHFSKDCSHSCALNWLPSRKPTTNFVRACRKVCAVRGIATSGRDAKYSLVGARDGRALKFGVDNNALFSMRVNRVLNGGSSGARTAFGLRENSHSLTSISACGPNSSQEKTQECFAGDAADRFCATVVRIRLRKRRDAGLSFSGSQIAL